MSVMIGARRSVGRTDRPACMLLTCSRSPDLARRTTPRSELQQTPTGSPAHTNDVLTSHPPTRDVAMPETSFTDLNADVLLHIAALLTPMPPTLGEHWLNGAQPTPSLADVRALRATCRHARASIPAGDLDMRINDTAGVHSVIARIKDTFGGYAAIARWVDAPADVLKRVKWVPSLSLLTPGASPSRPRVAPLSSSRRGPRRRASTRSPSSSPAVPTSPPSRSRTTPSAHTTGTALATNAASPSPRATHCILPPSDSPR